MKKIILIGLVLILLLFLVSCGSDKELKIDYVVNKEKVGSFSLLGPTNGEIVTENPTFSWTASENAEHYTLEVCTSEDFTNDNGNVYVKKVGITSTSYTLFSTLTEKETTYFWRVTASNGGAFISRATGSFYFDSIKGEVSFPITYADEWKLHELGSKATTIVDKTDFFNNGQNSLRISFVSEDTNQAGGGIMSDGWIVLTNTNELEMWGNDAFYFNFYYSGNDSNVSIRVIDEDNEYWVASIKLAQNAKQTIILKFEDFKLRLTGDTPIVNQKFDYNRIKSIELCFEKTFGDGVAYISDIKAISTENYKNLFIDTVDFSDYEPSTYLYEGQQLSPTISEDGSSLTLSYSGLVGYGITKLPVGKLTKTGDAFKLKIDTTNVPQDANILIRVLEEDGDRWFYKIQVSTIPDGEFVIPYSAFALSECKGDGARQFYFIKQLQFGVEHITASYSAASFSISNLSVATLEEEVENLYIGSIDENGMIEDFSSYTTNAELYYVWQNTTDNKDEQMELSELYSTGINGTYGIFYYKSDMYAASYGVQFNGIEGFSSVSFLAYDQSYKSDDKASFGYLDEVHASLGVTLYVVREDTGKVETFTYIIPSLSGAWTKYEIAFTDFVRDSGYYGTINPIKSENIRGIQFSLGYYYKLENGASRPVYTSRNPVLFDNISLGHGTETTQAEASYVLKPSDEDSNICIVDTFDSSLAWKDTSQNKAEGVKSSNDTPNASGSSMDLSYLGSTTASSNYTYESKVEFDESVTAKALVLSLKGDGTTSVKITISRVSNGKASYYSYEIKNVKEGWNKYEIGFSKFVLEGSSSGSTLDKTMIPSVSSITITLKNTTTNEIGHIYVDDLYLDGNLKYSAYTITALGD